MQEGVDGLDDLVRRCDGPVERAAPGDGLQPVGAPGLAERVLQPRPVGFEMMEQAGGLFADLNRLH